jgi:hypothetical protein
MLYDIHTGNPLDVPPLTQAFIATAEPYAVTEAQALKMLGGMAPGKHTFAEITEAARKHANTDLFHRGPSGRVFVRVGREFHAVGVGKSNGARLSTSSRPDSDRMELASHAHEHSTRRTAVEEVRVRVLSRSFRDLGERVLARRHPAEHLERLRLRDRVRLRGCDKSLRERRNVEGVPGVDVVQHDRRRYTNPTPTTNGVVTASTSAVAVHRFCPQRVTGTYLGFVFT